MQLRSVCLALDSFDALPLDHPVVDVVLRQAMYQKGPFNTTEPNWTWHAELLTESGQDLLYTALHNVIDRIESSPKLYKCVPLIISLTHFLAGFDPERGADLSNSVGRFCSRWADERRQCSNDDDSRVLVAQYWYFAARAFAHGCENHILHAHYTSAIVAAHHAWVWNSNHPNYKDVVGAAASTFSAVTSNLISSVRQACQQVGCESILTNAVRKVKTVGMPDNLVWHTLSDNPTAYVSTNTSTSDQYMMNIHTGLVLMNGLPVDSLPADILGHPLYIRTFGRMNFEVFQLQEQWKASRIFATICNVAGCGRVYHFAVSGNDLLVRELPLEGQPGRTLSLLPHSTANHLSTPISELYGHWADIESDSVYMRGIAFNDRNVGYVVREDTLFWISQTHRQTVDWCAHNPDNDDALVPPLEQVIEGAAGSVVDQVVSSLKHFEPDYNFIESRQLSSSPRTVVVVLTRYSLEFDVNLDTAEIRPRQWRGMRFAPRQQLPHQLPNFTRYFVLVSRADSCALQIIVPHWGLKQNSRCPKDRTAQLKYASYSLHPTLQLLEATTLRDRLQLACIQVSSCNGLPQEPSLSSSLTGVEASMVSLKACFPHKPFSAKEVELIDAIIHNGRWHPYVVLRCVLMWQASDELAPLHTQIDMDEDLVKRHLIQFTKMDSAYGVAYLRHKERIWPTNLPRRLLLTTREEKERFGITLEEHSSSSGSTTCEEVNKTNRLGWISRRFAREAIIQGSTETLDTCKSIELQLQALSDVCERYLLDSGDVRYKTSCVYPLHDTSHTSGVEQELRSSWDLHVRSRGVKLQHLNQKRQLSRYVLKKDRILGGNRSVEKGLFTSIRNLFNITPSNAPAHVEITATPSFEISAYLLTIADMSSKLQHLRGLLITELRAACAHQSVFGKMAELGHAIPTPTIADLLRAPLEKEKWCSEAISAMLCWMTATVLSDKLSRLWIAIGGTSSPPTATTSVSENMDVNAVIQVLASQRVWDVSQYPSWLIFEVVNRLQSWPEQARVAMRLCREGANGDITQLNMGLGKTRVIVPFVVLHSVFHTTTGELPRMQVLPELEAEFTEYASLHLGASPVCPIHIVSLPFSRSLELCCRPLERLAKLLTKSEHIAVVTNPTSWLSMKLHLEEVMLNLKQDTTDRMKSLLGIKRFDILDEADMSLHHRFRLAYSWGAEMPLPDGPVRWNTLFGLLRLRDTLPEADRDAAEQLLQLALQDETCVDFRRLQDQNVPISSLLDRALDVRIANLSAVALAMRSWLGFGVLTNACSLRYRVQYGLRVDERKEGVADRDREPLAVPYRACDTPAPKAHFAHPDMSLALTTLTYLNRGLDRVEMTQAIKALNAKGIARKLVEYTSWCSSANDVHPSIDRYAKLDPTNAAQFDICFKTFRLIPSTIYFWLGEVLFPSRFTVFPEQLMKTAFDVPPSSLEVGSRAIGFSGTKEAHSLLPSQVHLTDMSDDAPELQATDGSMLDLVYNTATCVELEGYNDECSETWKVVLNKAIEMKVNAIIDRGGLLVGVSPRDAVKYLFSKGITHVTFFEDGWRIADSNGRELPKAESPVPEADTMVIYDEARTRGSDMKLKRDAVALLTIDSRTTKDDFMQAVGRLRQFARRQKVVVTYAPTLELPEDPTEIARVLRFVVNNSVQAIDSGLIPWCDSATRHGAILGGVPNSLEPCPLALDVLYAAPCIPETPHKRLQRRIGELGVSDQEDHQINASKNFFAEIEHRVTVMEQTAKGNEAGTHLEVELERHQEIEEEEEEVEKQHAQLISCAETSWNWNLALGDFISVLNSLKGTAGDLRLLGGTYSPFAKHHDIQSICTPNYWNVFSRGHTAGSRRRRSAFLWFPSTSTYANSEYVLLTHYECSNILPLILAQYTTTTTTTAPVHLCFLGADSTRPHWSIPPLPDATLNSDAFQHALLALLLEDGRTMFTGALSRHQLKNAVTIARAGGSTDLTEFAKKLVGERGRLSHWDGSKLEDALI